MSVPGNDIRGLPHYSDTTHQGEGLLFNPTFTGAIDRLSLVHSWPDPQGGGVGGSNNLCPAYNILTEFVSWYIGDTSWLVGFSVQDKGMSSNML